MKRWGYDSSFPLLVLTHDQRQVDLTCHTCHKLIRADVKEASVWSDITAYVGRHPGVYTPIYRSRIAR